MRRKNLDRWLSVVANFGILIGLILVALEINLANVTARAEMATSFQDRWVDIDISWQDAEFSKTWAKSLTHPDQLTTAEMLQLSGFMWTFVDHIGNYRLMWDLDIFADPQESYEVVILSVAPIYFGSSFGRAWYEENKSSFHPTAVEILDKELPKLNANEYLDGFARIQQRIDASNGK